MQGGAGGRDQGGAGGRDQGGAMVVGQAASACLLAEEQGRRKEWMGAPSGTHALCGAPAVSFPARPVRCGALTTHDRIDRTATRPEVASGPCLRLISIIILMEN
jgi:hypothetical protein